MASGCSTGSLRIITRDDGRRALTRARTPGLSTASARAMAPAAAVIAPAEMYKMTLMPTLWYGILLALGPLRAFSHSSSAWSRRPRPCRRRPRPPPTSCDFLARFRRHFVSASRAPPAVTWAAECTLGGIPSDCVRSGRRTGCACGAFVGLAQLPEFERDHVSTQMREFPFASAGAGSSNALRAVLACAARRPGPNWFNEANRFRHVRQHPGTESRSDRH